MIMSDLEEYFFNNRKRRIHKWLHYFDIYERHFNKYRGKDVVLLEMGVYHGGSLQMWKNYFGNRSRIIGVDSNPECKIVEEEGIQVYIGSQSDRDFLQKLKQSIPPVDILIDDGGHTMEQQTVTYEELFSHVKDDGVYLCEDLHTSYWPQYGGGYRNANSFIEYSKHFIDYLNAFHSKDNNLKVNAFTRSVNSIHYYDSILVVEKSKRIAPSHKMTGCKSF